MEQNARRDFLLAPWNPNFAVAVDGKLFEFANNVSVSESCFFCGRSWDDALDINSFFATLSSCRGDEIARRVSNLNPELRSSSHDRAEGVVLHVSDVHEAILEQLNWNRVPDIAGSSAHNSARIHADDDQFSRRRILGQDGPARVSSRNRNRVLELVSFVSRKNSVGDLEPRLSEGKSDREQVGAWAQSVRIAND